MPNFSHHGVSSPWNAPTSAVRYSDAYNPYLRSPSDWYATTDCNPSARGRDVTRSCRTCHTSTFISLQAKATSDRILTATEIPPTELSNACAVHGSQPLCVGCKCLICEETFPAPGQPQAESEKEERKVSSKPKPRLKIRTQAHEEPRRYQTQTSTQHQDMGRFSAIKREQAREGGRRSHFV